MYFPVGWPKVLNLNFSNTCSIRQLVYNRDKVLFVILTEDSIAVYYCKPCLCIVIHRRNEESVKDIGINDTVEWKPDSSALVVATSLGCLLFYKIKVESTSKGLYELVDPPQANLRRDSAELFVKEVIPPLDIEPEKQVYVGAGITSITCVRDELMVAVTTGHIYRYKWNGDQNRDYSADLKRIPFSIDQRSKAIPVFEENTYITEIEYSPLNGGFAVVLNDGRAGFLTASCLRFDPNTLQGVWAPSIDDATCTAVNHKFRLITFGRKNSQGVVYSVDETTGGLSLSHKLAIPSQVFPSPIGEVCCMRWSPDSCVLAISWKSGGVSLWSVFGALLMCSLAWDYGLSIDLSLTNPLTVHSLDWSAEGYQLWMVRSNEDSVLALSFVKSVLTVNPCMSHHDHLYLQGEDRLYIGSGAGFTKVFNSQNRTDEKRSSPLKSKVSDNKQWNVVQIPSAYSATNWPIRFSAIDREGTRMAVAGRAGLAHYSTSNHKWKLFGNETQEKDMLVTGGLLWWRKYVVAACYNVPQDQDELRFYASWTRLSDVNMTSVKLGAQPLLLDQLHDRVLVFCADCRITIYDVSDAESLVKATRIRTIDMSGLGVHPACFVAITLFSLRTEASRTPSDRKDNFVINVSGRVLMVDLTEDNNSQTLEAPVGLASCVENIWSPCKFSQAKPHLTEALWLFCGAHGMRVWLPLFPRSGDHTHTYMSKRIMLPFQLKVYPLAVLFEDAIILGVENDTMLYSSDTTSVFSLPFCVVERTSQVYLHQVLRQLIKRNLGYHAWEIARSCTALPYFPHSLELLLHEVLEEEATSKDPIPDAQLPSIIEFIQEFPVYLDTVVQCARKTEIALWPYLFSVAGKPKDLFQKCLASSRLDTAASYLIILQNLEPSTVSRQYATMLLDSTLHNGNWELSKELVRFLKAIDPNDVEHTRASLSVSSKYGIPQTPTVNNNEEDLSLVLGTSQVSRARSFSTTATPKIQNTGRTRQTSMTDSRKKSVPSNLESKGGSAEEFFMDKMVERHARRLLYRHGLKDLGRMAAVLDFPLVSWLAKERNRAASVEDIVSALRQLHESFGWPYPRQASMTTGLEEESDCEVGGGGSLVGDSGYRSYQSPFPRPCPDDVSIASEVESWQESGEWAAGWAATPVEPPTAPPVKGSPKSEIQLRYLLQLLTDAGCLQWALAVSVVLLDAMAVQRVANAARSPDQSYQSVVRLRDDFVSLLTWAQSACPAYKSFAQSALQPQISYLDRLVQTRAPPSPPPSPANINSLPPPLPSSPVSIAQPDHASSCSIS